MNAASGLVFYSLSNFSTCLWLSSVDILKVCMPCESNKCNSNSRMHSSTYLSLLNVICWIESEWVILQNVWYLSQSNFQQNIYYQ
jgi:hypothetical protein